MICVLKLNWEKYSQLKMNCAKKYFFAEIDGQGTNFHLLIIKRADHDNF